MATPVGTLPIPEECRSALLYGGAFDPPHIAHIKLPPLAREALACELLVYLPAGAPPLKDGPVASSEHRVAMLQTALEGVPSTAIATLELERDGQSFTVDTLRKIREARPNTALRFLIGADQARQFHMWREAEAIITLAEPAVMLRPPLDDADDLLPEMSEYWSIDDLAAWRTRFIELPAIEASSTRIRELLAARQWGGELESLLPAPVAAYVRARDLYAPGAS